MNKEYIGEGIPPSPIFLHLFIYYNIRTLRELQNRGGKFDRLSSYSE